jgi:integrase/recombinase XerD
MNNPNVLALAVRRFLGEYLPHQRAFSAHTIRSYRDSLKLLLQFAAGTKRRVADLTADNLMPEKIIAFLDGLEQRRGNDARNVRLSAIHSFFDYLGAGWPEHLDQARRVLAITFKRTDHRTIDYLEAEESRTLLEQIDRRTVWGRRDYVLLALMFNTGARVQKVVALQTTDLRLTSRPSVKFFGKGRRERICPLCLAMRPGVCVPKQEPRLQDAGRALGTIRSVEHTIQIHRASGSRRKDLQTSSTNSVWPIRLSRHRTIVR